MVVGYQDLQTQGLCLRNTLHAGDAVVNRDQDICARLLNTLRNGGCEAIAIDHAVGHDIAHVLGTQHAQAAQANRAGRGAVAIVVGHNAQAFLSGDGIGQQDGSGFCAFQCIGRQQLGQTIV